MSRLGKAALVAREEGLAGVWSRVKGRTYGRLRAFLQREWPHAQGRMVELVGNRWRIEGVTIRVDNPCIARRDKWQLLGAFEQAERSLFRKYFPADMPLIELGGCLGVLACIANRRLADPREHVVVEAHPGLVRSLQQNRDLNRCEFRVVHAAIAYDGPVAPFHLNPGFASGSILGGEGEAVSVPARTLSSIAAEAGFERFNLLCDIEGAEAALIEREGEVLRDYVEWLLVEIHDEMLGDSVTEQTRRRLRELGFQPAESIAAVTCYCRA